MTKKLVSRCLTTNLPIVLWQHIKHNRINVNNLEPWMNMRVKTEPCKMTMGMCSMCIIYYVYKHLK